MSPRPQSASTNPFGRQTLIAAVIVAGAVGAAAGWHLSSDDAAAGAEGHDVAAATPAGATAPAAAAQPAAGAAPHEVVLKTGERLPAAQPPVVALGRVIYVGMDGNRHALAADLVDVAASKAIQPQVVPQPQAQPQAALAPAAAAGERRAAPDFEAKTADGKPVKLSDLKGKVVLVDFWATWCGPCVQEMPNVKRAYDAHSKKGFEIVGVSLDHDRNRLDAYTKAQKMAWPQMFDGKGWGNDVARKYGVRSIPYTVLVDRKGNIARVGVRGPSLESAIAELLAEKT